MQLYYDLHMHSALSPCGDNDMTPNNLVNMAYLKQLDMIALTDHNCAKNLPAAKKIADELGMLFIPGMEIETSEEIHMVAYFETVEGALELGDELEKKYLPKIKNRIVILGYEYVLDEKDSIVTVLENLLTVATTLSFQEASEIVPKFGGVCVPAHVDKSAYSVFSNLGYIPPECSFATLEISKKPTARQFANDKKLFHNYNILQNSDAHYLQDIAERENFIEICGKSTKSFLDFVKNFSIFF